MKKFKFTALALDGTSVSGVQEAVSPSAVHGLLRARDLEPVKVTEKKSILQFEITKKKVPARDLMHFSRQLAVFVRAGIPILEALRVIAGETGNKVFKLALDDIIHSLETGLTFSAASSAHPEAFPSYYLSILRSAELTGNLDIVLDELADYIDRDIDTRQKVRSALVYPAIVAAMAVVVVIVLTVFVLPRFEDFFADFDAKLPLATRMLLGFAGFMGSWGWLIGVVGAVTIVGGGLWFQSSRGRPQRDALLLKLPVLGDLLRHSIIERFCRIFGSMLTAGVAVPDALSVSGEATNNVVFRRGIAEARDSMLRGEGLATPLAETGLFPTSAKQMFRVGEDTGTFDEQLGTCAAYLDRELEYKIKRFTSMFEPAVIVGVGVVVGFVAIALVSAMYGVYNQVDIGGSGGVGG